MWILWICSPTRVRFSQLPDALPANTLGNERKGNNTFQKTNWLCSVTNNEWHITLKAQRVALYTKGVLLTWLYIQPLNQGTFKQKNLVQPCCFIFKVPFNTENSWRKYHCPINLVSSPFTKHKFAILHINYFTYFQLQVR